MSKKQETISRYRNNSVIRNTSDIVTRLIAWAEDDIKQAPNKDQIKAAKARVRKLKRARALLLESLP